MDLNVILSQLLHRKSLACTASWPERWEQFHERHIRPTAFLTRLVIGSCCAFDTIEFNRLAFRIS